MNAKRRLLLIVSAHSYRSAAFVDAAIRQGLEPWIAGSGRCALAANTAPGVALDIRQPEHALHTLEVLHADQPFAAVLGTDDTTSEFAATAARRLGLPGNAPEATRLARRKDLGRAHLAARGLPVPTARVIDLGAPLEPQLSQATYPCVIKPVALSASRGVIRVDDRAGAQAACRRIAAMVATECSPGERDRLVLETFIPGIEVALEGILDHGRLRVLALFDKPDPLDGPYFEETYYITPARVGPAEYDAVAATVQAGCDALGLVTGPVHAECRINDAGVWLIEIAGRSIGGLCSRLLRFGTDLSLEDLIVLSAAGGEVPQGPTVGAAGVLMLPVPDGGGVVRRVEGVLAAGKLPLIEEIILDIREGHVLVPWPEGSSYPGFVFARGPNPDAVEAALREACAGIELVTSPLLLAATA